MTQETLYVILGIALVIGISLILWKTLPWRSWAVAWVGNDIKRCRVYEIQGEDEILREGRYLYSNDRGMLYRIKAKPRNYVLCVPNDYTVRYVNGYRKLVTQGGDVVPLTLEGGIKHEPIHLVSSLVLTGFLTNYVNRIGKQGAAWWLWLLILAGVGVLGFFLYQQFMSGGAVDPSLIPSPTPKLTPGADPIIMGGA